MIGRILSCLTYYRLVCPCLVQIPPLPPSQFQDVYGRVRRMRNLPRMGHGRQPLIGTKGLD